MRLSLLHNLQSGGNVPPQLLQSLPKVFIVMLLCGLAESSLQADNQIIPLTAGTNLIAFQLVPTNPAPSAVFGSLGANFVDAWTYDNVSKQWTTYRNPSLPDAAISNSLSGLAMGPVSTGRGYYVRVAAAGPPLAISGNPPASTSVQVYPGLNLLGFPVPSTAPSIVGLQDLLNGPAFSFPTAFLWEAPQYLPFTGNGLSDDKTFLFDRNKALWVQSTASTVQTWTPQLAQPPLVYIERGESWIVEAPIAGAGGTSIVNVPVKLTRPYAGPVGFLASGTAHPNTDFAITNVTTPIGPTNSIGTFTVNAPTLSFAIPVIIKEKTRLQTNSSVLLTLRRPVETPAVQDSATLPQVAHIKITDGMNGIYEGFLKGTSASATLNGQNFRVALRANGRAIIEAAEGGMIQSRLSFAYTLTDGVPQLSGPPVSITLPTTSALGRSVSLTITPGTTVDLGTGTGEYRVPSFEIPLTLRFDGLIGGNAFTTNATFTLTQADPAL